MVENGLDLRTWLTIVGIFVLFFGLPAATIAFDLRKQRRSNEQASATDHPRPPAPPQTRMLTHGSGRTAGDASPANADVRMEPATRAKPISTPT